MSNNITTKMRELYFQEEHTIRHMGPVEIAQKGTIDNLLRANEIETEITAIEFCIPMMQATHRPKADERIKILKKSLTHYAKMVP
jgi:hypothetical protein